MELLIKQKVFSWTDSYYVYDGDGKIRYEVVAEFLTLGHQIHVWDCRTKAEVGSIHQRLLTFLPAFEIVIGGMSQGRVSQRPALFRHLYDVDFRGWQVEGDAFGWDYSVVQGDRTVMTISKELFRWSDTYVLRYTDPAVELPGLLLVLAIDAAHCN